MTGTPSQMPAFTQEQFEEWGELGDIARFLLIEARERNIDDAWKERLLKWLDRRQRLLIAIGDVFANPEQYSPEGKES